ncbi:MAG: insulinase family protein [Candidatus Sericytochromatia bacterium]|nr:insulinase family protein [Candidatus Tanganyikabacteria bacterium]
MTLRIRVLSGALAALAVAFQAPSSFAVASSALAPPAPASAAAATKARVAVPVPARFRLSSGLEVLLVERHDLPIVALQLVIRTGAVADPPEMAGLASLTADLLTEGAGKRTAAEIADTFDFLGATFSSSGDYDKSFLRLDTLEKDFDAGLEIFADALLRPVFAQEEIDRIREQRLAGLESMLDDANRVLAVAADRATYGTYPYGRLDGGTTETLGRIGRDDVLGFYSAYYRPDNAFLVVVGDISATEVRAKLDRALGAWTGKAAAFTPPPPPLPIAGREVRLVDMDVTQSYIQLENLAIRRNHPDYFPAMLMSYILGGGSVARLYRDIRDAQGLAYGAYSYLQPRFLAGKLTLELQTKLPSTDRALASLLAAMRKMRDAGPTDEEMTMARDYFTGSFALRLESNGDLAREITNTHFYGLGDDYLAGYQQRIRGVTKKQVHEAARRYLDPTRYSLTIVSKADEVESRLAQFGRVTRVPRDSLIR